MRYSVLFFGLFIFFGCSSSVKEEDLTLLNGYWEIEQVTLKDGTVKEYTVNTMVDFISLDGLKGYRKKMKPKFDGTFETSNDAVGFWLVKEGVSYEMSYSKEATLSTQMPPREEILELTENSYSIRDLNKNIYKYKRFQPINVSK